MKPWATLAALTFAALLLHGSATIVAVGVEPWDFPGVSTRFGLPPAAPAVGDTAVVVVTTHGGVQTVHATVQGRNVSDSWSRAGNDTHTFLHTTFLGDEAWPWAGLEIAATAVDGEGTPSHVTVHVIPGSTWTNESSARGLAAFASDHGNGICMADVDDDNDVDFFVAAGEGASNQLWINDGTGHFVDGAATWGVAGDASSSSSSCAFGDADGDGLLDLFVTRFQQDVNELYMNTGSEFVEEGAARHVSAGADSSSAVWGDIDGDGNLDIFVCNWSKNVNFVLINNGTGWFSEDGVPRGLPTQAAQLQNSHQAGLVDFQGDGDLDVLVLNFGANELLENAGGGEFAEVGAAKGFSYPFSSRGLALGDWNGDGLVDVFLTAITNTGAGMGLLYEHTGAAFVEVGSANGVGVLPGQGSGAAFFDVEADGDLDIAVGTDAMDAVLVNSGAAGFASGEKLAFGSDSLTLGLAAGDIDGDGDVDVMTGLFGVLHVNHNARPELPRTVVVRPLTASGAQAAFGAVVHVTCVVDCGQPWSGLRVIDGGSSQHSQHGYDAIVGVPTASAAYNISVVWVGGGVSNSSTHPRLGGVLPSLLLSPIDRLFVVRPVPATVSLTRVDVWAGDTPPIAGDNITVVLAVSQWVGVHDLALTCSINGKDVTSTLVAGGGDGVFTASYATAAGEEMWPWSGVSVEAALLDSGGLEHRLAASVVPGSTWSEEHADRGLSTGWADASARGVCLGDVDSDGDLDMFVAVDRKPNQLWLNTGDGVFSLASSSFGDGTGSSMGCSFGDADGDGLLDLFVTRMSDSVNELFMNTGDGFVEEAAARGVVPTSSSSSATWGDIDGDSDLDVFVVANSAQCHLFVNNGTGGFEEDSANRYPDSQPARQAVMADVDGDADLDIVVVSQVANQLYMNDGQGVFMEDGAGRGFQSGDFSVSVVVGDWNSDGAVDIYVGNLRQRDALYVNDGSGTFSEIGLVATPGESNGVATFDIEADGDMDVVLGTSAAGCDVAWVNDGGLALREAGAGLGFGCSVAIGVTAGDIDGDGDADVMLPYNGKVYVNHNAHSAVPRVIIVRPLTASHAQSAFGATVRVTCLEGCAEPWVGLRVIDGGSGFRGQSGYDAIVGVPHPDATYAVSVVFPGGATHDGSTDPSLTGITPSARPSILSRTFHVQDRPYIDEVAVVTNPDSAILPIGASVHVTLTAGRRRQDLTLLPGDCCYVNGVQVRSSFANNGDGTYNLTYVVGAGDPSWEAGELSVYANLWAPAQSLTMVPLTFVVDDSPSADTSAPVVVLSCHPGLASPHLFNTLCMACVDELVCNFDVTVVVGADTTTFSVPSANKTSLTSASVVIGPFADEGVVQVLVTARDWVWNTGTAAATWRVDTTPPDTTLVTSPPAVTSSTQARFELACSEPTCSFSYVLDDGPVTQLGGNTSSASGASLEVETLLAAAPRHVTNVAAPTVVFRVETGLPLVNATVEVTLGTTTWSLPVHDDNTSSLQLPAQADGTYTLSATAQASGVVDVTPIDFAFAVDTVPPTVAILDAPEDGATLALPHVVAAASEPEVTFMWRSADSATVSSLPWLPSPSAVFDLQNVSAGAPHTVEVFAVDQAGNSGPPASVSWTVNCPTDAHAAVITSNTSVSPGTRHITFAPAGGVEWASYEYAVDGSAWVSTPRLMVTLTGLVVGVPHTFAVRPVVSTACVEHRPPAAVVAWLEEPPPPAVVTIVDHPPAATADVFAVFAFNTSRTSAWLQYRLDGVAEWTPCSPELRFGPVRPGEHTLEVRAVDVNRGSPGATETVEWVVTAASDSTVSLSGLPDGDHSLEVTATDDAGLVEEAPARHDWRVDTTPPSTQAVLASPVRSSSPFVAVNVSCAGEVDPCEYCWSSGSIGSGCSFNTTLALYTNGDGEHRVSVTAKDSAGWTDAEAVAVFWELDTTPPNTTLVDVDGVLHVLGGDVFVLPVADLRLGVSASEDIAGYDVLLGGVPQSPLDASLLVLQGLPSGENRIQVWSTDMVGNMEAPPVELVVLVDVTPPRTAITSLPTSPTPNPHIAVNGSAVDNDGGTGVVAIVFNAIRVYDSWAASIIVNGSVGGGVFTGLASGEYNVTAAGVDGAGHVDPHPAWGVAVVDLLPPNSSFTTPLPPFSSSPNVSVGVTASEVGTVWARVDGGPWVAGNASQVVELAGLVNGAHVVEVRAVDEAGNEEVSPYAASNTTVDSTPPGIDWDSSPPRFTATSPVQGCFSVVDATPVEVEVGPAGYAALDGVCVTLSLDADGTVEAAVSGVDAAGNEAPQLTAVWTLDRVPPLTLIGSNVSMSEGCSVVSGITVCSSATAARVNVSCLDVGSPTSEVSPCTPRFAVETLEVAADAGCVDSRRLLSGVAFEDAVNGGFTPLPVDVDGLYAVALQSEDAAGNVEASNTTLVWHVDTTAPTSAPVFDQSPAALSSSSSALFVMRVENDASPGQLTFWFSKNDAVEEPVPDLPTSNTDSVQLAFSGLDAGFHKVEAWVVDQAGRAGPRSVYTWDVVSTAPVVNITATPAQVSADAQPSFSIVAYWLPGAARSGVEPAAGIEVSLGGGDGFVEACATTAATGGVCVWNATLPAAGTYTVNVRAVFAGATGDPEVHTWEYRVCSDAEVAVIGDDLSIECQGCPVGANCVGGLTDTASLVALPGFWTPPGSSSASFYECPVEEACLPGGELVDGNTTVSVVSRCAEGYTGTLCAVCEDGFFEQFGLCVSCGTQSGVAWLIMFAVLMAVVFVAVLFFKFRELMPIDQLKVTLSMVQIIASANTAYDIPWPPLFADFLNTMRVFLIEAVSLTRANCAQPMSFYGSLVVTLVAFKVVLAVIVLGPVLLHKWRHRGRSGVRQPARPARRRRSSVAQAVVTAVHAVQAVDWAKVFKITFLFLFVAYPGVSLKIMKTFKCVEVEGQHWLVADMRLRCFEGDWFGYALYAFIMACLYTLGLPLAITVILWRNRKKLAEEDVVRKWGFLFETYGVGAYLWEVVELLRKLWLSALVVLMEEGSPLQVTIAVLISGWAHVLHAVYKPWRGVGDGGSSVYSLQHGSLFVTSFVFIMGLLFKVEGVGQDGGTYDFLAWAMLVACVGFLIGAAFVLVRAVVLHTSKARAKASLSKTGVNAWSGAPQPGSRVGMHPRAVRASRLSGPAELSWVGNPLKATPTESASCNE